MNKLMVLLLSTILLGACAPVTLVKEDVIGLMSAGDQLCSELGGLKSIEVVQGRDGTLYVSGEIRYLCVDNTWVIKGMPKVN